MQFELLGKSIEITDGQKNYMNIRTDFSVMADKAISGFNADIANSLIEKFEDSKTPLNYYYERYVSETRKYLTKYGVYTISDGEIWKEFTSLNYGETFLQKEFNAANDKIIENASISYSSPDDRSYYIFKNLLKLLDSGYLNDAIRIDIMVLGDFVVEFLSEHKLIELQVVYEEDSSKAEAIYENLISGIVPREHTSSLAASLIELDFSNEEYYAFIFKQFPQSKFEVAAIAKCIGIDLSDLIEEDLNKTFNLSSITCEEDALKMMATLKEVMARFSVTSSSRKDALETILQDYDTKARTYGGIVYKTRELRAQAEKDDIRLRELHGDISILDKGTCKSFIEEISPMDCAYPVKIKHLQQLNNRVLAIDNEYLETLIAHIETFDEAMCNQVSEQILQYDAENKTKEPYINRIKERIKKIWDAEDFERFTELYLQTPLTDTKQIADNCTLIDSTGRTESKELFIKALTLFTEVNVETAAKYAVSKDGGLFASIANMGRKETYEALTLNGRVMHPAILNAMEATKSKKGNGLFGFGKNKSKPQPAQSVVSAKFCSNCGTKIDDISKFCSSCGHKLT